MFLTIFFCTHHLETGDICFFTNKIYSSKRMAPNNKWTFLTPLKFFYTVTIRWLNQQRYAPSERQREQQERRVRGDCPATTEQSRYIQRSRTAGVPWLVSRCHSNKRATLITLIKFDHWKIPIVHQKSINNIPARLRTF